jgi:uncharacterized protein YkwD
MVRLPRAAAAIAALVACAHAPPPAAPPPPGAPTAPAPAVASGRYGPEPAAEPTALERAALEAALPRLQPAPRPSAALALAARALAAGAADGARDPLSRDRVRLALAGALAYDPAPVAHLVEADPARVPDVLAAELREPGPAFTHAGVGAVVRGRRAYLVLLLSRRHLALDAFPRDVAVGATATLHGELSGLEHPSVHVTAPSGESRTVPAGAARRSFSAPIRFDARGRWLVEVVGEGPRGPEVLALLTVSCGGAALGRAADGAESDPPDRAAAESRVVTAIQATRAGHDLPPLEARPELTEVARRHSEAMLAAGTLAHVLPGSGTPAERLHRARVPFALALENVAMGASALAAHRAAEESPAHRQNILSREVTRVGIGIARGKLPGGERVVYLTEIFLAPVEDGSDDRLTPEARVREAIWRERARTGAAALASDPRLDELARSAARRMAARDEPAPGELAERALALGRNVAAVDAFVAARTADAARSKNLADRRFGRAGVGVATGGSGRYGAGMLFIAVVYTD